MTATAGILERGYRVVAGPRLYLIAGGLLWMIAVLASFAADNFSPLLLVSEILLALGLLGQRQRQHRLAPGRWIGLALVAGGVSGIVWPLLAAAIVGVALFVVYPIAVVLGPGALSVWALVLARQRRATLAVRAGGAMVITSLVAIPLDNAIPGTLPVLALGFGALAAAFGIVLPVERTFGTVSHSD